MEIDLEECVSDLLDRELDQQIETAERLIKMAEAVERLGYPSAAERLVIEAMECLFPVKTIEE